MTFRAPKLLLGLALVLTLAPKGLPKFSLHDSLPRQADATAEMRIAAFLSRNGFEGISEERKSFGPLIQATLGSCRLRIVEVDANGATRDKVRLITTQDDHIAFIFDGTIYADQPMLRAAFSYSWTRLLNRIGVAAPQKLGLGVAASNGCSLEKLPWGEIDDAFSPSLTRS